MATIKATEMVENTKYYRYMNNVRVSTDLYTIIDGMLFSCKEGSAMTTNMETFNTINNSTFGVYVDWTTITDGTTVKARNSKKDEWILGYFASYDKTKTNKFNMYIDGRTKWSSGEATDAYKYMELAY